MIIRRTYKDKFQYTTISFDICGKNIFSCMIQTHSFWFRIFNKGLTIKDTKYHPLLFSERYKYVKGLTIGSWFIKTLK